MENLTAQHPLPTLGFVPEDGEVDRENEVAVFGLNVGDARTYAVRIEGSAPLAATLIDGDGVTVSALEDGEGANPLEFEVTLAPGAYTLHVRAAQKGTASKVHVGVTPSS